MGHMTFCFLLLADYSALRESSRDIINYVVDGQHEEPCNSRQPQNN